MALALAHETGPPAEPLLAAALLDGDEVDGLLDAICGAAGHRARRKGDELAVRVKSLDVMLEGGLKPGQLVGVSGDRTDGGVELCFGFVSTCLLQHPDSTVAVIDSSGNLDLLKLYNQILSRLRQEPDLLSALRNASGTEGRELSAEDVAAKVLDRVNIMRVFDFVGILEAVSEIRDEIEGRKVAMTEQQANEKSEAEEGGGREAAELPLPVQRTYVADSEDEEDDDILFDVEVSDAPFVKQTNPDPEPIPSTIEEQDESSIRSKVKLILIDSLVHVLNPILKKDYIQGNALASSFLLTLSHLTRAHSLFTLLLNPSSTPRPPSPVKQAQTPHRTRQPPPPPPSIFTSVRVVPALGNILPKYLDVHLLVSQVPRRKVDARIAYAEDDGNSHGSFRRKKAEMAYVGEVVADRWEGRTGDWGTFLKDTPGIRDL